MYADITVISLGCFLTHKKEKTRERNSNIDIEFTLLYTGLFNIICCCKFYMSLVAPVRFQLVISSKINELKTIHN